LATRALLDRYESDAAAGSWRWESTVVDVVLRYGSRADANALLPVFLRDPEGRERLVPVFALHGDDSARAAFSLLLWNPRWEAYGGGTGSDR
jgi:hypothetical protein